MQEKNWPAQLHAIMDTKGINQPKLAKEVGISQSTVSRALREEPKRLGEAHVKLSAYIRKNERELGLRLSSPRDKVIATIDNVWDNADTLADAIARVIKALEYLLLQSRGKENE